MDSRICQTFSVPRHSRGITWFIYGGLGGTDSGTTGNATNNTVIINGPITGTGNNVFGGYSPNSVYAGAIADYNTVIFNDAFSGTVFGGFNQGNAYEPLNGNSPRPSASYNSVIFNGAITGEVHGGQGGGGGGANVGKGAFATNNTVTIAEQASSVGDVKLYGGSRYGTAQPTLDNIFTNNTLNFKTSGFTAAEVQNFQILNFTLPGNISDGDTMLTVDSLDYRGSATGSVSFNLFTPGSFALGGNVLGDSAGKTYTLLDAAGQAALNDSTSVGYSLFGRNFTCNSATSCDPINLSAGRVQGTFTLTLDSDALKLEVKDYAAPNTALTWTGTGSTTWSNYNAATPVNNWSDGSAIAYLDGDTVTFGNTGAGTVTIDKKGVTPADVVFNSSGNYTLVGLVSNTSGALSGETSLTKNGTGKLTFTGINLYTGGTTVYDGILSIASDTSLGTPDAGKQNLLSGGTLELTGTVYTQNWTLAAGQTHTINVATSGTASATFAGQLSGADGLVKTGTNTLVLAGDNTYTGDTTISAGSLSVTGTLDSDGVGGNGYDYTDDIIVSTGGSTLSFQQAVDQTISGVISGDGNLTKAGTGILTLTNANNAYTGATTINSGTLRVTGRLGSGAYAGNIANAGALVFNQSAAQTLSGIISGTGTLTKENTNTLILTGTNTYTGVTTVSGGILQIGNAGTTGNVAGNITNNAQVTFNRSDDVIYAGVISGSGTLIQTGTGTLILTGNNTFTGVTTVGGGGLQIGNGSTTGSVVGNITNNSSVTFNRSDPLTYAGIISSSGNLTQAGSGTLTLTGNNTYTGTTTVTNGTLSIGSDNNIGSGTNTLNGGALDLNSSTGPYSKAWAVAVNSAINAGSGINATLSGVLSGAGGITKTGTGTITLTGTNAYGNTIVFEGMLKGNITANTNLTVYSGATYDSNGVARAVSALSGAGTVAMGSTNLTVQSGTFSGEISGTGTLTKTGTGLLLYLDGSNTYSGGTIVNGGTLQGNITDNTSLFVDTGATYLGTGAARTISALTGTGTVEGSGSLAIRSGTFSGKISGAGNIEKIDTGILTLSGTTNDYGNTTLTAGTLSIASDNNIGSGLNTLNGGTLALTTTGTAYSKDWTVAQNSTISTNVAAELEGDLTGAGGITKDGTGTLTLSGANTYAGNTTVTTGTLEVTGTLGTNGIYAGNISNGGSTSSLIFNQTADQTLSGILSGTGTGGLTKAGTGTLTLEGANTYTGDTTVSGGVLSLTGSVTSNVVVNSGATFALTGTVDGDLTLAPNASLNAGAGGTITGNLTATGDPILKNTAINLNVPTTLGTATLLTVDGAAYVSDSTINITSTGTLGTAVYTLLESDGISDSLFTGDNKYKVYGVEMLWSGTAYTQTLGTGRVQGGFIVTLENTNKELTLDVNAHYAPNTTLTWRGGVDGTWVNYDVNTSPKNWNGVDPILGGSPTDLQYLVGDTVIFDDTAIGNFNITIAPEGVAPEDVIVNNSSYDYTIGGGAITDTVTDTTSLTKTGSGTLTLTGNNTYTGGTTVNGGTLQIGDGGATGNVAGDIVNNAQVTFNRSDDLTFNGNITGSGNVSQIGTGTLTLAGSNAYGATTVGNGATLSIGSDANIGTGTNTLNGGTLELTGTSYTKAWTVAQDAEIHTSNGVTATLSGALSGSGGIEKTGHGTLVLTGTNAYGTTTVTTGTLSIGSDANIGSGTNTLNGGTLDLTGTSYTKAWSVDQDSAINADVNATLSGNLSGAGAITKTGTGTLTLSGTNTYGGDTTVTAGTLAGNIADGTDLTVHTGATYNGSGAARTINDLSGDGTLTSNNALVIQSGLFSGVITGAATLTKDGGGTLYLSGANDYTGATIVNDGTLEGAIANGTDLYVASSATYLGTGAARTVDVLTGAGTVKGDGNLSIQSGNFSGNIGDVSGIGRVTKTTSGTLILSGNNTYGGGTTVNGGTLQIGNGGTSGEIAGNIENNANVTFNRSGTVSYANVISGTGNLTKAGGGTLELTGTNTYTGMTTVEAGTLQLTGSGTISDKLTLHGGATFDSGTTTSTLSRLDIRSVPGSAMPAVYAGDLDVSNGTVNFYAAPTTANGNILLTVTGTTDLSNANVNVGIAGSASPLRIGDQLVLINSTSLLPGTLSNSTANGTGMQGVTLKYEFGLTQTPSQLLATITSMPGATEESKSISEGYLSGMSFLGQGSDFLLGKGLNAARDAVENSRGRPEVFAALGYGKIHNQTGSSVAVKGYNLVTGLAFGNRLENANLTAALFFEYGNGDYNSYNSFSTGKVQGRGDTGYKGIGVLARSDFNNGVHIEGSVRGGKVDADYRSNELVDNQGRRASYDTKSGYFGAHIGGGKRWTLNERNSIETYAQGIWTRQGKENTLLSTGERLKFDAIDSKRLRVGTRFTHAMSGNVKAYAGIALEREFGGEAKATTQGYRIDAPTLKGNTGIVEVGVTATPSPGKPFLLDFGIQGYAGKREGVTGSLRVHYFF